MIKTYNYVFEDTGVEVIYKKVSSMLLEDAKRILESKKPQPRIERIEVGDTFIEEPQDQDKAYLERLAEWNGDVNSLYAHMVIDRAVVEILHPDWEQETQEYLEFLKQYADSSDIDGYTNENLPLKVIFIEKIATGSDAGFLAFVAAVRTKSEPTEEEIQKNIDSFRPTGSDQRNGAAVQESRDIQPVEDRTVKGKVQRKAS